MRDSTEYLLQPPRLYQAMLKHSTLSPLHLLFIFALDSAIVNGVYWSEALNKVFVDNFERDPSLIWQYFGSAKGFFRQYPGECVLVGDDGGCWAVAVYVCFFINKSLSP